MIGPVNTNKGSVLTFSLDKLVKIDRSYNAEINIKTTLKSCTENEGNNAPEMSRNYDVNLENDSDGSDGCDGSRGSAQDNNDTNVMVVTAPNQQEISLNLIEEG